MIEDQDEFTRKIQQAIIELGKENARILSAQISGLVQEIRQGNIANTYLLWRWDDAPQHLKAIVNEKFEEGVWILYTPHELRNCHELPQMEGLSRVTFSLPVSGEIAVYRQPTIH